jgi:ABC-2 type transport system permease protein
MRALVVSPIVVLLAYAAGDRLALRDPKMLGLFLLSLVGAWLLIYFMMVLVGALAFFVDSALGVFDLWIACHAIFSGYLVPLESLPAWIRGPANVLPFRFILGFPVELLVGLLDPATAARQLAVQWGYVLVLAGLALLVWRAGVRRYQAFGG